MGFLEEEDLPATNHWVFLGLGGQPGSVGYIPTRDLIYQCFYLLSQLLPLPKDLSGSTDTGPSTRGYGVEFVEESRRSGTLPTQPTFLSEQSESGGRLQEACQTNLDLSTVWPRSPSFPLPWVIQNWCGLSHSCRKRAASVRTAL